MVNAKSEIETRLWSIVRSVITVSIVAATVVAIVATTRMAIDGSGIVVRRPIVGTSIIPIVVTSVIATIVPGSSIVVSVAVMTAAIIMTMARIGTAAGEEKEYAN